MKIKTTINGQILPSFRQKIPASKTLNVIVVTLAGMSTLDR